MRGREPGPDLRLNHLVGKFLTLVDQAVTRSSAPAMPKALAAIVAAMRVDLSRRLQRGRLLSALTTLSASQTRRLFRKRLRARPRQWLKRERLAYAQSLIIRNHATLAEIADACGFSDVYHFSREFKHAVGISPSAWRSGEVSIPGKALQITHF